MVYLPSVASIDGVILFLCLCVVCHISESLLTDWQMQLLTDRVKRGNMPYSAWVSENINKMSFFLTIERKTKYRPVRLLPWSVQPLCADVDVIQWEGCFQALFIFIFCSAAALYLKSGIESQWYCHLSLFFFTTLDENIIFLKVLL